MGGELKNTFCLLRQGKAVVSQHLGDMADSRTARDAARNLALYQSLFAFAPQIVAVDQHVDYVPTRAGLKQGAAHDVPVVAVQHHHAHIAACLAEHGFEPDAGDVLGVVLDGLGAGDDGEIWGGEFLLANFHGYRKLGGLAPVVMPGGDMASVEPWRNTWAHLEHALGWQNVQDRFPDLELVRWLRRKPLATLARMKARGVNSPAASSCGRLFDAVAAAVGVCRERISFESEAAIALESLARAQMTRGPSEAYGCTIEAGLSRTLTWRRLWTGLLEDLSRGVSPAIIAARFHQTLIDAVLSMLECLSREAEFSTLVLSGGVFQNRLLLTGVQAAAQRRGLTVLSPATLPANDGGLALGQAAIAAATAPTCRSH